MGRFDFFKKREVADIYARLRGQAISLDPAQIGLKPDESNSLFGVLMEMGHDDAVITLSTIGDGTVSLYFSNGAGIIGLGEHEGPRKACFSFLSFAEQFIPQLRLTKKFPLPKTGQVTFYFLTINGVLTANAKEDDLGNYRHSLSPLFHKAHEVITEARLVDEKRRRDFHELMNATEEYRGTYSWVGKKKVHKITIVVNGTKAIEKDDLLNVDYVVVENSEDELLLMKTFTKKTSGENYPVGFALIVFDKKTGVLVRSNTFASRDQNIHARGSMKQVVK